MHQDLTAKGFVDTEAEHRRKIREERYAAQRVGGSPALSAPSASHAKPSESLLDQLLSSINRLRVDPISMANALNTSRRPYFQGTELHLPNATEILITAEGVAAVDDAVRALKGASPLCALDYSPLLARAAQLAATAAGAADSENADGISEAKKIGRSQKHGITQLVQFGSASADEYALRLIVDDGDHNRQGRAALLSKDVRVCGFGSASHPTYGRVLVLLFTDAFNAA